MATAPHPRLLTISIKQQRQKLHTHGFILGTFSPRELCARGVWHFGTLPADLRRSSAISDAAKLMWSALAEMEAIMPEVRPGLLRLAREIGKSRSTAIRAIEELEDNGLIQVLRQPRQKARPENSTNLYRFILNCKLLFRSTASQQNCGWLGHHRPDAFDFVARLREGNKFGRWMSCKCGQTGSDRLGPPCDGTGQRYSEVDISKPRSSFCAFVDG